MTTWEEETRRRIGESMERYGLSPREQDVAWALFAVMASTQEIADALYMEPSTVKNHITSIGQRLGVMGRLAIVLTLLGVDGLAAVRLPDVRPH